MQRIFCPKHKERTPSVVIYDTHAWCFGGCGRIELSDLGSVYQQPSSTPPPVDLRADLERINNLPRASVRGLNLPVDGDSYYIVWPEGTYYKRRKFFAEDGSKYLCPRGHKKPLLVARKGKSKENLVIIEGEIEALTLAGINGNYDIVSPGGVGSFKEGSWLNQVLTYKRFCIIVDKDNPGFKAAVELKRVLLKRSPYVDIVFKDKTCDINDILVKHGKEALEKFCERIKFN